MSLDQMMLTRHQFVYTNLSYLDSDSNDIVILLYFDVVTVLLNIPKGNLY